MPIQKRKDGPVGPSARENLMEMKQCFQRILDLNKTHPMVFGPNEVHTLETLMAKTEDLDKLPKSRIRHFSC